MSNSSSCPSDNTLSVDQTSFWNSSGVDWDAHRIGWAISGACAAATVLISLVNIINHARHYTCPPEQRQILRIIYMPPIYAVISFLSYRFFRSYTYYDLIEVVYEAITITAFLLLLIEYVAATATEHSATKALERKDKRKLPLPFCCWRYRPTKAYFMYTVKWSVMQYVVVRPLVSIIAIICQAKNILCESQGFDFHYANAYLEVIDTVSITVALYGLFVFYGLTRQELEGRRPLAKFLSIKLIVMFTFYQTFVFDLLEGRVIKPTQYWTATNIADGLNALTICIEMVFFACLMLWAYPASEYKKLDTKTTGVLKPLWDSINYTDFFVEILDSLKFFWAYFRGKPGTHTPREAKIAEGRRLDFGEAFGVGYESNISLDAPNNVGLRSYNKSEPMQYGNHLSRKTTAGFDDQVRLTTSASRSARSVEGSPTSAPASDEGPEQTYYYRR